MKNFLKKHWWKPIIAIWGLYVFLMLMSNKIETNALYLILLVVIVFAGAYDMGKNSK